MGVERQFQIESLVEAGEIRHMVEALMLDKAVVVESFPVDEGQVRADEFGFGTVVHDYGVAFVFRRDDVDGPRISYVEADCGFSQRKDGCYQSRFV